MRDEHTKGGFEAGIALLPPGDGWLLAEFGGQSKDEVEGKARPLIEALKQQPNAPAIAFYDDPAQQGQIWHAREGGVGASSAVPGEHFTWPSWEDSAVPPEKLGDYLRDLRKLMDKYGYSGAFFGHFGQGCLHTRISFDLRTAAGVAQYRAFIDDAADLVLRYGGSLSGEHGEGQVYSEVMPKMYGPEIMQAFHDFKYLWDPRGKMNPGKVVDAYRVDQNLRLGPEYDPPPVITHFKFPDDQHSFNHATVRCIGIGKCRKHEGGTMCPSYMVTREEEHSTRGRIHLLFEMLQGDPIAGWKNESVKEALDLCLACKGCKGECPVKVDMATYKAEFLAHYYVGRLRPPSAYAMGLIDVWARLAERMPGLVNFTTHAPLLSDVAKRAAGVAPQRQIPAFAPYTFKEWFRQRPLRNEGCPQVMLWPDTFNNHFHPHTAQAAVAVLEAAGFQVVVPQQPLCCGRPLYDYGMLDRAKRLLLQILDALRPQIQAGIPVVGLEPSCTAVFRDEMTNLLPDDQDARRLRQQTFLLSEFLVQKAPDYQPPTLKRKAVVHGHCHHKAIMGMDDEETVLRKMGLDLDVLDSGCCGMAGSFGYERGDRYDVSIACGERVLLPAVRDAAKDTLIVANGFSCRGQIAQQTDRHALHLAQVLQMAMREGSSSAAGAYPEQDYLTPPAEVSKPGLAAAGAGALLAGAALTLGLAGRLRHD